MSSPWAISLPRGMNSFKYCDSCQYSHLSITMLLRAFVNRFEGTHCRFRDSHHVTNFFHRQLFGMVKLNSDLAFIGIQGFRPCPRAVAKPAYMRSRIRFKLRERSEQVKRELTARRPVSMASFKPRKPAPSCSRWLTHSIKFLSDRPSRSNHQTISVSPACESSWICFNPGRSATVPII